MFTFFIGKSKSVIIVGVDNGSPVNDDNRKKKDLLVIIILHYNIEATVFCEIMFENEVIWKKDSETKTYPLCLGDISYDFTVDSSSIYKLGDQLKTAKRIIWNYMILEL